MGKRETVSRITEVGLIPILRTAAAEDALALAEVLAGAGLPLVEIPLTVPGAVDVIRTLARKFGDALFVGAGTVLSPEQAELCVWAGARFIISPAVEPTTIAWCKAADVAVLPGALTPTEIVTAWRAGADLVKLFPASALGGPAYVQAIKAPLPEILLVPTGGVSLASAASFVAAGATAIGVGGDLVDVEALRAGRPEIVADKARRYVEAVRDARRAA